MSEEQVAEAPVDTGQAPSEAAAFDFRQHIDEGLRDDPSLSSYKDINGMAKSLINAQKMVGADKVAIPGTWGTDQDWGQVYDKLGRPTEPGAYEFEVGENIPETSMEWFREVAHEVGLNNAQAQQLLESYSGHLGASTTITNEALEQHRVQVETDLKKEWGDEFGRKMAAANDVVDNFTEGLDVDLREMVMADGTLLGDDPKIMRMFANVADFISERLGEDQFSGRDNEPGLTNADIQKQINELTRPGSPYWDKQHPEHDNTVNETLRLRSL